MRLITSVFGHPALTAALWAFAAGELEPEAQARVADHVADHLRFLPRRHEHRDRSGEPSAHAERARSPPPQQVAQAHREPRAIDRELIERALPYQLSARTSYTVNPDGVHCAISLPVSATAPRRP